MAGVAEFTWKDSPGSALAWVILTFRFGYTPACSMLKETSGCL